MNDIEVSAIRKQFPIFAKHRLGRPFIYFDSAATSHKPTCVIEAISDFYSNHYATVHRAVYESAAEATAMYDRARQTVQRFIGAEHLEEIIFTRGTTESINLVAKCFGKAFISKEDEIIVCQTEHHSNIIPWQMLCEEVGAKLKIALCHDSGEIDIDYFLSLLSERTKLVAIAHVSNVTGTVHPIKKIISLSHEFGAKVLIDAAQSISHMKLDVIDLDADFLAFSGHKAYGPTGIGVLYGKKGLLEIMPPYFGGGDMVELCRFEKSTYQKPPLRFEAGTPMIAEVIALGSALAFIDSIGRDNILAYEYRLLQVATEKLSKIEGFKIIGTAKDKGPIISFVIEGVHPLDLGTMLSLKGVAIRTGHMCAQPTLKKFGVSSLSRISFGIYNTMDEIDEFIYLLQEVLLLLRPAISY